MVLQNPVLTEKHSCIKTCVPTDKPLIPGEISKKILFFIKNGNGHIELLKYGIHDEEIRQLSLLYKKKVQEIPIVSGQPKYFQFYHILKDKVPEVSWTITGYKNGKPIVNFNLPLLEHLQPSLLSLLLDRVRVVFHKNKLAKYNSINLLDNNNVNFIQRFMDVTQALYPTESCMARIVEWINLAQSGKDTTIFVHTCPDYAAEPIGNSRQMYKHTFSSLGEGIGQIARRVLNILPHLKELLINLEIKPTIIATIADYEAFSKKTLERMNLTKNEFLKKVEQSRLMFQKECDYIIPLKTLMFTEICGGEKPWLDKVEEIKAFFAAKNFGQSNVNSSIFLSIAKRRKALYKNWFSLNASVEQCLPVAINQAAEYAAIGFYITNTYPNCLVLGADSVDFAEFYNFYKVVPSLYFKRFYC